MSDVLIQQIAERLRVTPAEAVEQAVRFAYANAKMENPNITIEMVREAATNGDA